MSIRSSRIAVLCAALALAVAAPARAQSPGGAQAPEPVTAQKVVTADGQVALAARAGTLLRRVARFRGSVPAADAGRAVTIERFDELGQAWLPLATTTAGHDGTFVATWRADRPGRHRVRAILPRTDVASAAAASAELAITVHRRALATWYGPGFYGRRTACGRRMSRSLLGVAHRRLPCGTPVALLYRGRTITVPVVDRGPFVRRVKWDLTAATAAALGLEATARIGALRLRADSVQP